MKNLKLVIGSDHGGINLKNFLYEYLKSAGYVIEDYGTYDETSCDYPDIAVKVAQAIQKGEFDRGILICGSGLGMCITANRFKGVRAIVCTETYSAKMGVRHNNSNVLALGERVLGKELAREILDAWLEAKFDAGRHQLRVDKIDSALT